LRYPPPPRSTLFPYTTLFRSKGELPTTSHFRMWQHNIKMHTLVHENVKHFIEGFRYDAHPMGILIATAGALSTFYPEAKNIMDLDRKSTRLNSSHVSISYAVF